MTLYFDFKTLCFSTNFTIKMMLFANILRTESVL